jgi:hypothetical protein
MSVPRRKVCVGPVRDNSTEHPITLLGVVAGETLENSRRGNKITKSRAKKNRAPLVNLL